MARLSHRDLARVEREFERLGLLLEHDQTLSSFTALALGEPIRGSWWSHPRTHEIYDLLQVFKHGSGSLEVKLLNGKVTFVHPRLWPALLDVARGRGAWQRQDLSKSARSLLGVVQRRRAVRADQVRALPPKQQSAAIRELELRLLVHTTEVHTETGAHRKLLRTWARWCADAEQPFRRGPSRLARAELEEAAHGLASDGAGRIRLPWSPRRA